MLFDSFRTNSIITYVEKEEKLGVELYDQDLQDINEIMLAIQISLRLALLQRHL